MEHNPLKLYRASLLLDAESAGLEWQTDGKRIRELAVEVDQLKRQLVLPSREQAPAVSGFYWCGEELSDVWIAGEVDPWPFAFHALDFIASELECHTTRPVRNLTEFAFAFGPSATAQMFDLVDDMMGNLRRECRRFEVAEYSGQAPGAGPLYGRLDDADPRFEEAGTVVCSPDDVGATLITVASLDMGAFQGLGELVEQRDALARRAMRGEAAR